MEPKYFEFMTKRMDRHGEDHREGMAHVNGKIDNFKSEYIKDQKEMTAAIFDLKEKVLKLETQNSLVWKLVHYGVGLGAGFLGGLFGGK